jgi:hypothetical protein
MGVQAIYGPGDHVYNFTDTDALTEQSKGVAKMGGGQFKLRLAPQTTCSGYKITTDGCDDENTRIHSLLDLVQVPAVANAFSLQGIVWYQFWMYSYFTNGPNGAGYLRHDWTPEMIEHEYNETKAWAVHMLTAYSGTGKVFMAGNWEGDWALMSASGCKKPYNMSCDPSPKVMDRMVAWGQARQRAIDDARSETPHNNVYLVFYMEMNLGPEAVTGKPGMTNDVIPKVNPDFVSYSSYSATNAYATTTDVAATDEAFHKVLDYVASKLPPAKKPAVEALALGRRVFVGEYGSHGKTDYDVVRFVSRVMHAGS